VKLGYGPNENGLTSHYSFVKLGQNYMVDDDLNLWFFRF